jgi:hypothetical protein
MKRLYATTDPTEAEILRALLRDAGIESTLDNEGGAAYAVGLPTGAVPLGITVADGDAAAGAEVLAAHFEKQTVMEDDPEAPPPPTPEESARFEEKVRRDSAKMRRRLAQFFLILGALSGLAGASVGSWEGALVVGGSCVGLVALVWFVSLLAEPDGREKGPAPRTGDGPSKPT